jgi:hypothetical protein
MKNKICLFFLIIMFGAFGGCGDSSTSPRVYTDSLTLGTGRRGDDLVGETTAFTGGLVTIYWRVESREEFGGAHVEFVVEKKNGVVYETVFQTINELAGFNDHVLIASYYHTLGTGLFRATGFIGSAKRMVGSKDFTVR